MNNPRIVSPVTGIACENIRNFCIIAHIDHGKSTLADRLLEHTGTVEKRQMQDQLLDDMELERARGITIKARAVTMGARIVEQPFELNLIDTPGHVDFQGVEAQTVANAYAALEHDLEIIPVINKIDLKHQRADEVAREMEQVLGLAAESCIRVSAKTGVGIDELLQAIVRQIPPPQGKRQDPLQAMSSILTMTSIAERSPIAGS